MQNTQIDPLNHEQQLAYELVANTNSSFFLTGRAGSGKTTFLHNVQKLVGKQFITLAPTGVAAILAGVTPFTLFRSSDGDLYSWNMRKDERGKNPHSYPCR